jgi:hypothetical protein
LRINFARADRNDFLDVYFVNWDVLRERYLEILGTVFAGDPGDDPLHAEFQFLLLQDVHQYVRLRFFLDLMCLAEELVSYKSVETKEADRDIRILFQIQRCAAVLEIRDEDGIRLSL